MQYISIGLDQQLTQSFYRQQSPYCSNFSHRADSATADWTGLLLPCSQLSCSSVSLLRRPPSVLPIAICSDSRDSDDVRLCTGVLISFKWCIYLMTSSAAFVRIALNSSLLDSSLFEASASFRKLFSAVQESCIDINFPQDHKQDS